MSYRAGSAYVTVRPDMASFSDEVEAGLSGLDAQAAQAGASAGAAYSEAFAAAAHDGEPDAAMGSAEAGAALDDATRDRSVHVGLDDADALAKGAALDAELDDATRAREAPVGMDEGATEAKIAALQAQLDDLTKKRDVNVDSSGLDQARSSALGLAIAIAAVGLGGPLLALGPLVAGVGAAFGAAAMEGGGFTSVLHTLLSNLEQGASSATGFGQAVQQVGATSMTDFNDAALAAGKGAATLFTDLGPEIEKAAGFVNDLAQDFDKWAQSVNGSKIESFFSTLFGGINVGQLKTDLGDIASLVGNVAKAEHDMSPIAMDALSDVLNVLGHLPPAAIEALTALFIAVKGVGAVSGLIGWAESLGGQIDTIKTKMQSLFGSGEAADAEAAGTATGEAYAEGVEGGAATAGTAGEETAGELAAGAPAAAAAGAETGAAYAEGLEGTAAIGAIGADTAGELAAGVPAAAMAGAETGAAYAEGIEGGAAIGAVGADTAAELEAGAGAAGAAGAETGTAYAGGIAAGAEAGAGVAGIAAAEVTAELASAAEGAEAAGAAVGAGFAEGIEATGAVAEAAATEIAVTVDTTLAAALLIESPSKVARGRGQSFGQGFALGMTDTLGDVAGAAGSLAQVSLSQLGSLGHSQAMAALGAGGVASPMGAGALQLQVSYGGGGDEVTNAIVKGLRFSIQSATGGDVQAHLGRGKVRT